MRARPGRRWFAAVLSAVALTAGCAHQPRASTPVWTTRVSRPSTAGPSAPTTPPTSPALTTKSAPTPSPSPVLTGPPPIPPVSAVAAAEGLVDVRTVVPDAVLDLRYATAHNFTGVQLYPADARCLVHRSMVAGLQTAAARLRARGLVLVFWDCYRPHAVQVRMYQVVPNPNWVAKPGPYAESHEAGRSVDVTVAAAGAPSCPASQQDAGHCLVDMGTDFDDFTAHATAYATVGVTPAEQADRALLRAAFAAGGLQVYSGEWWHFDGPGSKVERPILQAGVD